MNDPQWSRREGNEKRSVSYDDGPNNKIKV